MRLFHYQDDQLLDWYSFVQLFTDSYSTKISLLNGTLPLAWWSQVVPLDWPSSTTIPNSHGLSSRDQAFHTTSKNPLPNYCDARDNDKDPTAIQRQKRLSWPLHSISSTLQAWKWVWLDLSLLAKPAADVLEPNSYSKLLFKSRVHMVPSQLRQKRWSSTRK